MYNSDLLQNLDFPALSSNCVSSDVATVEVSGTALSVAKTTLRCGGCTWSPYFGNQSNSTGRGYAVALPVDSTTPFIVSAPDLSTKIQDYMDEHSGMLNDPRVCIGTWVTGTTMEINLSIVAIRMTDALQLGKRWGQIAVYCLHSVPSGVSPEIRVMGNKSVPDRLNHDADYLLGLLQVSPLSCGVILEERDFRTFNLSGSTTPPPSKISPWTSSSAPSGHSLFDDDDGDSSSCCAAIKNPIKPPPASESLSTLPRPAQSSCIEAGEYLSSQLFRPVQFVPVRSTPSRVADKTPEGEARIRSPSPQAVSNDVSVITNKTNPRSMK